MPRPRVSYIAQETLQQADAAVDIQITGKGSQRADHGDQGEPQERQEGLGKRALEQARQGHQEDQHDQGIDRQWSHQRPATQRLGQEGKLVTVSDRKKNAQAIPARRDARPGPWDSTHGPGPSG